MKSRKDTTGLSSKEEKLLLLLDSIKDYWYKNQAYIENIDKVLKNNESTPQKILRVTLQRMIISKLTIIDKHTISGWINILIGKGYLKSSAFELNFGVPQRNSKYIIDIELIENDINSFNSSRKNPHMASVTTLESFTNSKVNGSVKDKLVN